MGLFCFESRKKTETTDGAGVGRGSSSVPDSRYGKDRITTSQDEGCPPPLRFNSLSLGPERIVTEFLGFSVIFYDFRIA